jgi:hypothetical protein
VQTPCTQVPPVQVAPQAPQLLGSLAMWVAQPCPASASQSAQPGTQFSTQLPAVHAMSTMLTPPSGGWQAWPQALQFAGSVASVTSQPLAASRSQSAYPELQSRTHVPASHDGMLFCVPQTLPQVPQLLMSSVGGVHHDPVQRPDATSHDAPFVQSLSDRHPGWQMPPSALLSGAHT